MTDEIAEWAKDESVRRTNARSPIGVRAQYVGNEGFPALTELAKMIEKYEQPSVDPLLIEARKIADISGGSKYYVTGGFDDHHGVQAALLALRRGIEMAEERNK